MEINPKLLLPSGVNCTFHGGINCFQDYVQGCQNFIATGRIDLDDASRNMIVRSNSPFEYRLDQYGKPRKGILLIHGLYDSPFTMRDLAEHFYQQGFFVRALLLPGHGTVPGDLLKIHYQEWIRAAAYGIESFANEVEELYLAGFSMGATLGLYHALQGAPLKAMILIAPALKAKRYSARFAQTHRIMGLFSEKARWYQQVPQISYARYELFPCNAAYQIYRLMRSTRNLLTQRALNIPLFVVTSKDDESTDVNATLLFFVNQPNPKNRLLFYTDESTYFENDRIITLPSAVPEQHILNFSHISLPIAPSNPYLGENGEYRDFQHYQQQPPAATETVYQGALSKKNLDNYVLQRLTYNPDFAGMIKRMDEFLDNVDQ